MKFTNVLKQHNAPFTVQHMQTLNASFNNSNELMVQMWIHIHMSKKNLGIATLTYYPDTSIDPNYNPEIVMYKGEDAAYQFIEGLQKQASDIFSHYIECPKPMNVSQLMRKNSSVKSDPVISAVSHCVRIESVITVIS